MSKYIVLYRHGIPEDKNIIPDDDLRSLSIRGRRLLSKSIAGFKIMLGKKKYIKIYSSPKLRAVQTAEMLSSELKIAPPQYFDFLANGGNIRLIKEIVQHLNPSEVAVLVGHQPFLSIWSQELSGIYLPFKKGTAVCFRFPNEGNEKAELRWYLQTRDFIKITGNRA
jgi:phosphohistidine phosphatase